MLAHWTRSTRIAAPVIAAVLLVPGAARAGTPITLDPRPQAGYPHVAVDAAGTAHVVWNERRAGAPDPVHYCRLPRGANDCDLRRQLQAPVDAIGADTKILAPADGRVIVLSGRCCA